MRAGAVENSYGAVIRFGAKARVAVDEVVFAVSVEVKYLDVAGIRLIELGVLQCGREQDCGLERTVAISLRDSQASTDGRIVDGHHQVHVAVAIQIAQGDIAGIVEWESGGLSSQERAVTLPQQNTNY